jgi:steroid delta-isomerase-like uncharacterized protein
MMEDWGEGDAKMKREEQIKVIEDFFNAMNDHDIERMATCCTETIVSDEVAESEPFVGMGRFKKSYAEVFEGYPDCVVEVGNWLVDGDTVICKVRWRATNSGPFRGSEPTGKNVDIRIAYFFELKQNKIDRITEYYDLATLLAQQGQLAL